MNNSMKINGVEYVPLAYVEELEVKNTDMEDFIENTLRYFAPFDDEDWERILSEHFSENKFKNDKPGRRYAQMVEKYHWSKRITANSRADYEQKIALLNREIGCLKTDISKLKKQVTGAIPKGLRSKLIAVRDALNSCEFEDTEESKQ